MPTEKWTLTKKDIHTITIGNKPTEPAAVVDQDDVDKDLGTEHDAIRAKEAGDVLAWLLAHGCLAPDMFYRAKLNIEAGKHRR